MQKNTYGWVILIIICCGLLSWVGSEMHYTINDGLPADEGWFAFISNLTLGNIDGMPLLFVIFLDCMPFFLGWIVYRQGRGQD